MALRYCPECDEWYETANYTVDETGETVCKVDGHGAVHSYIDGSMTSVRDYVRAEFRSRDRLSDEIDAAKRQNIFENHRLTQENR